MSSDINFRPERCVTPEIDKSTSEAETVYQVYNCGDWWAVEKHYYDMAVQTKRTLVVTQLIKGET